MKLIQKIKGWKLRNKCILLFLLLTIAPVICLGAFSYHRVQSQQSQEKERGLDEAVRQVAVNMNEHIDNYNTAMQFVVANKQVQKILSWKEPSYYTQYTNLVNMLDPMMEAIYAMNTDIRFIEIYNGAGLRSLRSYRLVPLAEVAEQDWYESIEYSLTPCWRVEGSMLAGYCRFPPSYHTEPDSILRITVPISRALISEICMARDYDVMLWDEQGRLIYASDRERCAQFGQLIGTDGIQKASVNGRDYYLSSHGLPSPGWTLTYAFGEENMDVGGDAIIVVTVLLIVLCLISAFLLAVLLTHSLVMPIEALNRQIQRVRGGEMGIVVRSDATDEIGQLTNGFGAMLKDVNRLIEEEYKNKIICQEAEFKALRAQINPHFLYNTLSSVNWMAIQSGAPKISKVINSLSRFYRSVLNNGSGFTTVREEIANVQYYLDIQSVLHDHSFDVMFNIDEDMEDSVMINLILQPIVENAIEHGVDRLESGRGVIMVNGCRQGERLIFTVENNGPRITQEEFENALIANGKGYGISNVQQRIQATYGTAFGLRADLDYPMGTRIILELTEIAEKSNIER